VLRGNGVDIYEYAYEFFPVLGRIMCSIIENGAAGSLDFPAYASAAAVKVAMSRPAKSASRAPAQPKGDPTSTGRPPALDDDAAKANKLLIGVMKDRFESLGLERSGLYPYYKRLMDNGSLIRTGDLKIRDLLQRQVPRFEKYFVLKSGVGSLPVLLAFAGLRVVASDANEYRLDAIRAVARRMASGRPAAGRLMSVADWNGPPEDPSADHDTLGIATGLILSDSNEALLLERLSQFDAILIEPRRFFGQDSGAPATPGQDKALERIGFTRTKSLPSANLALYVRNAQGGRDSRPSARMLLSNSKL
jgi:hypothetical protein